VNSVRLENVQRTRLFESDFSKSITLNTADRCIDLIIYETKFLELLDHINNDMCTIQISTSHKKREPVHCLT